MKNGHINARVCVEALILYVVLFLSSSTGKGVGLAATEFSLAAEITRITMYSIPSLALVWYILLRARNLRDWGIMALGKNDFFTAFISLICLLIIGFTIAFATSILYGETDGWSLPPPSSILGWAVLFISCISTGYLEESFFRFYILSRREALNLSTTQAVLFSTVAFAVCHIYGGPWFFLNSFLAGIFLCFIFLRYRSLHGIAIAHGLYNFSVYVINSFPSP